MHPHVELLTQHVRATLGVPGDGLSVTNAVLDTGSGVMSISETFTRQLNEECTGLSLSLSRDTHANKPSFGEARALERQITPRTRRLWTW